MLSETDRAPETDDESAVPSGSSRDRIAQAGAAATLLAASVLISLVFWPGGLDADSLGEFWESAHNHYTDWHTPILEWLWRPVYLLGFHSPGWALWVGVFSLLVGFYLVLRVRFSRGMSTLLSLLCCAFPPVLTWAIHVGDDSWFAAAIICAFGFAARSNRTTGISQKASRVAAVWFGAVAMAARHNAFPAVLLLFIVLLAQSGPSRARQRRVVAAGLGVVATFGLFFAEAGLQWALGAQSTNPVQAAFIYDVAQLSKQEHRVLFPLSVDPGQSIKAIDEGTSPREIDPLLFSPNPPLHFPVTGASYAALEKAWKSSILHNPGGYLWERLRLGVWMLSIGHPSYWLYNPPSSSGQYAPGFPSLSRAGYHYLSWLTIGADHESGTFVYDGWIYALVLVGAAAVLLRRNREDRVLAVLAMAVLFYTFVLEFSGPGELYRYVYPMVVAGTVLAPTLIPRDWHRRLSDHRAGVEHEEDDAGPEPARPDYQVGGYSVSRPARSPQPTRLDGR